MSSNAPDAKPPVSVFDAVRALVNWAGLVAIGILIGLWASGRLSAPPPAAVSAPVVPAATGPLALAPPAAAPVAQAVPLRKRGPFTYRFHPGEVLHYTLEARAGGTGQEMRDNPLGIGLDIKGESSLATKAVDTQDNGALEMNFDEIHIQGDFMGTPIDMAKLPDGTMHGMDEVSGMPMLDVFNKAVQMRIAPDGEVLAVSGIEGFDKMLSPASLAAGVGFPSDELEKGQTWDSAFSLPLPGISTPIPAKTHNVLEGYAEIDGRHCAIISQTISADIDAAKAAGGVNSLLGGDMTFLLPKFKVAGNNTLYFDVDNGVLAHSDIGMNFSMKMSPQMQGLTSLFGAMGTMFNEIEGGKQAPQGIAPPKDDSLEMGVNVNATYHLARVDRPEGKK